MESVGVLGSGCSEWELTKLGHCPVVSSNMSMADEPSSKEEVRDGGGDMVECFLDAHGMKRRVGGGEV
jgi:hypothetical protein